MQQLAYPRKTSDPNLKYPPSPFSPSPFAAARASTYSRDRNLRPLAGYALGAFAFVGFLLWMFSGSSSDSILSTPAGTPLAVIVTPLDPDMSERHKLNIKENRNDYAKRYGYVTFFPNTTDYDLMAGSPRSWSTVPALRHAMTLYPDTPWLFHLASTALIMNPRESLQERFLEPRQMESQILLDHPVVPPESIIKTFAHLKPKDVGLMVSQDGEGIAGDSLLVRTGDWAKFFLDAWYDPLYRSYNFQKAEGHALEHIVQWHATVLAKLAIVPQRLLNPYTKEAAAATTSKELSHGKSDTCSHRDRFD